MTSDINHVADTALWVAAYRSIETQRANALFHDPLATRLAGERGHAIAGRMPFSRLTEWFFIMRTVAIDRLVMQTIDLGVDAIVNLGAGLDTRPYRMNVPRNLRWIEVDFPQIIDYKTQQLSSEAPVCNLERITLDLSIVQARQDLLARLSDKYKKMLVITEGVVHYLSPPEAVSLSQDLFATPSIHYWIQDFRSGGLDLWAPPQVSKAMQSAQFKFDVDDWVGFFVQHGWNVKESSFASDEATRVRRPLRMRFPRNISYFFMPAWMKRQWEQSWGSVLYSRSNNVEVRG